MPSDPPPVLFGLETEFGIARDTDQDYDVVSESIALVRAAAARGPNALGLRVRTRIGTSGAFGSKNEAGHGRGANYRVEDEARPLSFAEIKVIWSSATAHGFTTTMPIRSTALRNATPLRNWSFRIVPASALPWVLRPGCLGQAGNGCCCTRTTPIFGGTATGAMKLPPATRAPWDSLVRGVEAFLVTRQIFAGAGKYGVEDEDRFVGPGFQ